MNLKLLRDDMNKGVMIGRERIKELLAYAERLEGGLVPAFSGCVLMPDPVARLDVFETAAIGKVLNVTPTKAADDLPAGSYQLNATIDAQIKAVEQARDARRERRTAQQPIDHADRRAGVERRAVMKKGPPDRADFKSQADYDKAYDRWSERQG